MKKKILLGLLAFFVALSAYLAVNYYVAPVESIRSIYLIPKDAIYVIEMEESIEAWERISGHPMWAHLRTNPYFAELTASANGLDSLVKNNGILKSLVGKRTILTSAHLYKRNDYDFLFVVDLERQSKLPIETAISSLPVEGYKVTKREFRGYTITELYDKASRETLYLAIVKNNLVGSYQAKLLEASIEQLETPEIGRDVRYLEVERGIEKDGMFRLYLQYRYLDDYMQCYMDEENPYVKALSEQLFYTGANCDLAPDVIRMKGFTNINDSLPTYLTAMVASGTGRMDIAKVAPQRTAFYMSLGFDSFLSFFENFEAQMKQDMADYEEYQANITKVEKFLKISLKENFMSWVDDELAFIQTQPGKLGKTNEFAVVLKAKDGEEAKRQLDFIGEQIKKKTPVKFREVKYKGYPIGFLSVKGFFRMMLGGFFSKLEKPYYTVIGNYVVFSNHPQTIKSIIDDYEAGSTLAALPEFQKLSAEFSKKSNVFIYLQTGVLHQNLREFVAEETWRDLDRNKPYIICFSHIGFQLSRDGDMLATNAAALYQDPNAVLQEVQSLAAQGSGQALGGEVYMVGANGEDSLVTDMTTGDLLDAVEEEEIMAIDDISPDDLDAKVYEEKFPGTDQVKFTVQLKNGLKHGDYIEYHPNGQIKFKGSFENDQQHGVWKEYDLSGKRIGRVRYKNGQLAN
jgi:hypothetical protein